MMSRNALLLTFLMTSLGMGLLAIRPASAQPVRIKDLGKLTSARENTLVGYGLVTGLAGTGDSQRSKATRQSLANLLSRFDVEVPSDDIQSRNVAVVMVTAGLSTFSRPGDRLDVTVTSIGDARSLAGGNLLQAPLKGPDGRVYALAQGALTVGGYRYDANGNQVQKNHPTVGLVSAGATVEVGMVGEPAALTASLSFCMTPISPPPDASPTPSTPQWVTTSPKYATRQGSTSACLATCKSACRASCVALKPCRSSRIAGQGWWSMSAQARWCRAGRPYQQGGGVSRRFESDRGGRDHRFPAPAGAPSRA